MTIAVTQEDISIGQKKSCQFCPIALALKRVFPLSLFIRVDGDAITIGNIEIPIPDSCHDFIKAFDIGMEVHPFTFELAYP